LRKTSLELAGVEEDPLAVRAAVDGDALELLLLHVVTAFRALHEMEFLETPGLVRLLLGRAFRLALETRRARRVEELLLVPEEPLVFALAVMVGHESLLVVVFDLRGGTHQPPGTARKHHLRAPGPDQITGR
jgi:hypothetical protein